MSMCSLIFYSTSIAYLLLVHFCPHYEHVSMREGFDYDNVTLPSFLGSIGKSVTSKISKESSTFSSKSRTTSSSKGSARVTPSTASISDFSDSMMTRRASNGSGRRHSMGLPAIEESIEQ